MIGLRHLLYENRTATINKMPYGDTPTMTYRLTFLILLLLLLAVPGITAQEDSDKPAITVLETIEIYAGPGMTYEMAGIVRAGEPLTIIERTPVGNWLRIRREAIGDLEAITGWIMTGYVNLPEDFRFTTLSFNTGVRDANIANVPDPDLASLYRTPVVPFIHPSMTGVFRRGQANGQEASVVTKVGDSNSASRPYLPPSDQAVYDLGPYNFLYDTVEFYGESFQTGSIAAQVGLNTFAVFDPMWASSSQCEPDETPLICEYRVSKASVALIMFGPNDVRRLTTDEFRTQMTQIVRETLDYGVIPVLSTFSANPEGSNWYKSIGFNQAVIDIANQFNVPVINLWSAARALPRYGVGDDDVHLTVAGGSVRLRGQESRYGASLQNLLVLVTLDRIKYTLGLD